MRHNKKLNHLSRKTAHRKSMLSNMPTSLIMHKRIFTTTAKAKALRREIEPIITLSKEDTTASRRLAFKFLQDKRAVTELFQVVAQKVADRPGGYTRIIKTGYRLGDNAQMCFIELVDFNESMLKTKVDRKARTRRSSKKKSEEKAGATEVKTEKIESKVAEPKAKNKLRLLNLRLPNQKLKPLRLLSPKLPSQKLKKLPNLLKLLNPRWQNQRLRQSKLLNPMPLNQKLKPSNLLLIRKPKQPKLPLNLQKAKLRNKQHRKTSPNRNNLTPTITV